MKNYEELVHVGAQENCKKFWDIPNGIISKIPLRKQKLLVKVVTTRFPTILPMSGK
jgi:hypothetical protein